MAAADDNSFSEGVEGGDMRPRSRSIVPRRWSLEPGMDLPGTGKHSHTEPKPFQFHTDVRLGEASSAAAEEPKPEKKHTEPKPFHFQTRARLGDANQSSSSQAEVSKQKTQQQQKAGGRLRKAQATVMAVTRAANRGKVGPSPGNAAEAQGTTATVAAAAESPPAAAEELSGEAAAAEGNSGRHEAAHDKEQLGSSAAAWGSAGTGAFTRGRSGSHAVSIEFQGTTPSASHSPLPSQGPSPQCSQRPTPRQSFGFGRRQSLTPSPLASQDPSPRQSFGFSARQSIGHSPRQSSTSSKQQAQGGSQEQHVTESPSSFFRKARSGPLEELGSDAAAVVATLGSAAARLELQPEQQLANEDLVGDLPLHAARRRSSRHAVAGEGFDSWLSQTPEGDVGGSTSSSIARSSSLAGLAQAGMGLVRKLGSMVANSFRSGSGSRAQSAAGGSALRSSTAGGPGGSISGREKGGLVLKGSESGVSPWSLSGMKSLVRRGSQKAAAAAGNDRGNAVSLTGWAEGGSAAAGSAGVQATDTTTASLSGWDGAATAASVPAGAGDTGAAASSVSPFLAQAGEMRAAVGALGKVSAPAAAAPIKSPRVARAELQGQHGQAAVADAKRVPVVPSSVVQQAGREAAGAGKVAGVETAAAGGAGTGAGVEAAAEARKPAPPAMPQQQQEQAIAMQPVSAPQKATPNQSPRVLRQQQQQQQQVIKGPITGGAAAPVAKPEALGTLMAAAGLLGSPCIAEPTILGPAITIATAGSPEAWVSDGVTDPGAALAGSRLGTTAITKHSQQQQVGVVADPRAKGPAAVLEQPAKQQQQQQHGILQGLQVGPALQAAGQGLQKAAAGSGALGYRRQTVHECVEELRVTTAAAPPTAAAAGSPASMSKGKSLTPAAGGILASTGVVMEKGPASLNPLKGTGMGLGGGLKVGSWLGASGKSDASAGIGASIAAGMAATVATAAVEGDEQLGVLAPGSRVAGVLGAGSLGGYVLQSKNHRLQNLQQQQTGASGDQAGQTGVPFLAAKEPSKPSSGGAALVATLKAKKLSGQDADHQQQQSERLQQYGRSAFSVLGVGKGPATASAAASGVTGGKATAAAAGMRPASAGLHQLGGGASTASIAQGGTGVALPAIVINKRRTTVGAVPERQQ